MTKVQLMILLLTFIFYLLTPFVLIMFALPLYINRSMVKIAKIVLRKELGNIVSPISNLFAVDKLYKSPTANLILASVYEGIMTKELICQVVSDKWLNKRDSSGTLSFPEVRQGLTSWLGFTFWENDVQFNVSNHVRTFEVKGNNPTRGNVRTLLVNLVNSPFEEKRSPWEVIIIPEYKSGDENSEIDGNLQTLVLFKVHHSLVDGFSMLNLGEHVLEDAPFYRNKNSRNSDHQYNFRSKLFAILRIPYFAAKFLINGRARNLGPRFPLDQRSERIKQVSFFNFNKIRLHDLKELKAVHGVTLSSLLLTGYVAGIKHVFAKNGELDMPTQAQCVIPVPLPGHPEKLRNHMSFATIQLPINEICPKKRLISLNESLNRARKSLDVMSMFYLLGCIGSFPAWLVRFFVGNNPIPFLLTNFPGPSLQLVLKGHRCKELFFFGGLLEDAICSCVGYEDNVHIAVAVDECFLNSTEEMKEFLDVMIKELSEFKNYK